MKRNVYMKHMKWTDFEPGDAIEVIPIKKQVCDGSFLNLKYCNKQLKVIAVSEEGVEVYYKGAISVRLFFTEYDGYEAKDVFRVKIIKLMKDK